MKIVRAAVIACLLTPLSARAEEDFCQSLTKKGIDLDAVQLHAAGCKQVDGQWVDGGGSPQASAQQDAEPAPPRPKDEILRERFKIYTALYDQDASLVWGGKHIVYGEQPGWLGDQKPTCAAAMKRAAKRQKARARVAIAQAACQDVDDQFGRLTRLLSYDEALIKDFEAETSGRCKLKADTCAWMKGRLDGGASPQDKGLRGPHDQFEQAMMNALPCSNAQHGELSLVNARCFPK